MPLPGNVPDWFESGSLSFAIAANAMTALAAIVTAGIAGGIAWTQKKIAKEQKDIAEGKLRLDLFERRFALFAVLNNFSPDRTWPRRQGLVGSLRRSGERRTTGPFPLRH